MGNKNKIYHSALTDELKNLKEVEHYFKDGNLVFSHDICEGYHDRYQFSEAIYAEPSWRAGFDKFMERAKTGKRSFKEYMDGIVDIIENLKKPSFIVCGKHHTRYFNRLNPIYQPIKLHDKDDCFIAIFYYSPKMNQFTGKTNDDVLTFVAKEFDYILDFSCGYGNTAKVALDHHKHFICSDVNKKCIYYIAKHYMNYESR